MMTESVSVQVSRHIAAPPERVFDAWLDPDTAAKWLFATPDGVMEWCEIDARVGGRFRIDERRGEEVASHLGEYLEIDRPNRLVFDFWTSFSEERTRIAVTIQPEDNGSRITLTHDGVWTDYEDKTRHGWNMVLEGLARTVE